MILKDILAISGEPGLFKFIAQGKNAIIVEHLETKKRSSAFGSSKVSSLEDIAVFTNKEDLPLGKVFDLIHEKENGGRTIDSKTDTGKLKVWFEGILPEYSKDKVYTSDIKKVAQWYNILHKLNLLIKEEPEKAAEEKPPVEKSAKAKPAKGKTAKAKPAKGKTAKENPAKEKTAPVVDKKKNKATPKPKSK